MKSAALRSSLVAFVAVGSVLAGCEASPASSGEGIADDEAVGQSQEEITAATVCPAGVPAALNVPAGNTMKDSLTASGVQVYMCNATPAGGFAWTFVNPQANLFDSLGREVGTHFIGPVWQGTNGSFVKGAKVAAATVDPTALPWLLLSASQLGGLAGRFSNVTYIQRLDTEGGNAPATTCDTAALGTITQVPYTAQYVFYQATTNPKPQVCKG